MSTLFAIQTKYLPPTAAKPARVKAWAPDAKGFKTAIIPMDSSREILDNHENAAIKFMRTNKLTGRYVAAAFPGGFVFVFKDNQLGEGWVR